MSRKFSVAQRNAAYERRLKKEGIDPNVKVVKQTSIPISDFRENAEEDGTIYRFMASTAGVASNLKITIEDMEYEAFLEVVHMTRAHSLVEHTPVVIQEGINEFSDSLQLAGGDRIILRIKNGAPRGIWIAFKWQGVGN